MDLEQKAIKRIKLGSEMSLQYYKQPLVCAYSGGKDSEVLLELFKRSGVPFEVHHSHTTVDAPPTVYHVRKTFRDLELSGIKCTIDYHTQPDGSRITMWNLILKKLMVPTRLVRYCCSELKETGCHNRMIALGIRQHESESRKQREVYEGITPRKKDAIRVPEIMLLTDNTESRRLFERCAIKAKTAVNPIIDWKDDDIWDFYRNECPRQNPLYDMGFTRVGCIGCPMAGDGRWKEFSIFPQYKQMYINAFNRMLQIRRKKGKVFKNNIYKEWKTGEDVFLWWMEDKELVGQMQLTLDGDIEERRKIIGG